MKFIVAGVKNTTGQTNTFQKADSVRHAANKLTTEPIKNGLLTVLQRPGQITIRYPISSNTENEQKNAAKTE